MSQEQILRETYRTLAPLQEMHHPDTKFHNTRMIQVSMFYYPILKIRKSRKRHGVICARPQRVSIRVRAKIQTFPPLNLAFTSVDNILFLSMSHVVLLFCFFGKLEIAENLE